MIYISDKNNCCGCSACVQVCPKQCISFQEDEEGFCYPSVGKQCIDCGLCNRVCPVQNQNDSRPPLCVYAAFNSDSKERSSSSSGGIFILLAKEVISRGGVVFGARWDGPERVVHGYAEDYDGVRAFQGSKYLQSITGIVYKDTESFLKQGRPVLFSGTPCQIAGLKLFLRKEYDSLLTVDVVCHGVPSPLIWRNWVQKRFARKEEITSISHRSKRRGWSDYGLEVTYGKRRFWQFCNNNDYFRVFYSNYTLRPSCYKCPAKSGKSHSDITLGDLWGISTLAPSLNDDMGASSIIINSLKGEKAIDDLRLENKLRMDYNVVIHFNPSIVKSSDRPEKRESFFCEYNGRNLHYLQNKYCRRSFKQSIAINVSRLKKQLRHLRVFVK